MILAAMLAVATYQDTAALNRAVAAFTARPIGTEGGARAEIDARLRLAQCPTVALSWRTASHDAVVVACSGPDWRIFVPVIASAAVPGATPAAPVRPQPAIAVIKRGDPVTIEAGNDGFSITREGIAAGDAAAGARVMVRVDGSTTPVQAVAIEGGRVTLPGWTG